MDPSVLEGRKQASAAGLSLTNYMGQSGGLTTEGAQVMQPVTDMPEKPEMQKIQATADSPGLSSMVGPLTAVNPVLGAMAAVGSMVVKADKARRMRNAQNSMNNAQRASISMYEDLSEGQEENRHMLEAAQTISGQYM